MHEIHVFDRKVWFANCLAKQKQLVAVKKGAAKQSRINAI